MSTDQIAAEAANEWFSLPEYSKGRLTAIIKSAIEKAHQKGFGKGIEMSRCLRCGAGPEWLQGKIPSEPTPATDTREWTVPEELLEPSTTSKTPITVREVTPATASEPVYHECKLGDCGVKLDPDSASTGKDEQISRRTARAIRSIAERAGLKITDDVELAWRDAILYALPAATPSDSTGKIEP